MPDVAAAVSRAREGDRVVIPAGTSTWNGNVPVSVPITIEGAGVGKTILTGGGFRLQTAAGKRYRVTGIEFRGGGNGQAGVITWGGTSHTIRVDHCFFNGVGQRSVVVSDWALGVIDHCDFDSNEQKVFIGASTWGGKSNGDGSWAAPSSLGTADAVYIEDCRAKTTGAASRGITDAEFGARFVVRHCTMDNTTVNNHGTQGQQADRGTFSMECYQNNFINVRDNHLVDSRAGNGVTWGNRADGGNDFMHVNDYRANNLAGRWGAPTGNDKIDDNYPGYPFEQGTHNGPDSATTLTDSTKDWSPANKWRGYSVQNMTTGRHAAITASTATTISYGAPTAGAGKMTWGSGNPYRIGRVRSAIDMCGMGTGDLLDRSAMTWPHQKIEGVFCWDNQVNGQPRGVASGDPYIQEGIHFFNSKKPGYEPFIYPHPLVTP